MPTLPDHLRERFECLAKSTPKHYNFDSYYKTEDGVWDFSYAQARAVRESKRLWEAKREDLFVIDAPPPTLSGELHVGHLFCYSHMDFIARYQRLIDKAVFMPLGIDNNGEPTKKLLYEKGVNELDAITKYMQLFGMLGLSYTRPALDNLALPMQSCTTPLIDEDTANGLLRRGVSYTTRSFIASSVTNATLDHYCSPAFPGGAYFVSKEPVSETASTMSECILHSETGIFVTRDNLDSLKKLADSINWHPKKYLNDLHLWIEGDPCVWSITREITEEGFGRDVFDGDPYRFATWVTSSLSYCIVINLLSESVEEYSAPCFPEACTHVRFLSKDIVTSWVYYSLLQAVLQNHEGVKPWQNLVVSGHCLTEDGDKISKSKHNTKVDPFELLETHNPDCVRYWAAMAPLGEDTYLSETTLFEGKKLEKKIWHASKWMMKRYDLLDLGITPKQLFTSIDIPDQQASLYNEDFAKYFRCLDEYDYHTALITLRDSFMFKFSGVDLSDISKGEKQLEREKFWVIITTFALYVACFSPFMPFVCDKVFETTFGRGIHDFYPDVRRFRRLVIEHNNPPAS